jgi:hypothetical protein
MQLLTSITGSNIIISGRQKFDLSKKENFKALEKMGVKQVYMIFVGEVIEGKGYSEAKQNIEKKLVENKIIFIPLPKEPKNPRPLYVFDSSVSKLKGGEKALVLCYHGLHNSAMYTMFHLLRKGWTHERIFNEFRKKGWPETSINNARILLLDAGIDIVSFHERQKKKRQKLESKKRKNNVEKFRRFLHSKRK